MSVSKNVLLRNPCVGFQFGGGPQRGVVVGIRGSIASIEFFDGAGLKTVQLPLDELKSMPRDEGLMQRHLDASATRAPVAFGAAPLAAAAGNLQLNQCVSFQDLGAVRKGIVRAVNGSQATVIYFMGLGLRRLSLDASALTRIAQDAKLVSQLLFAEKVEG